MFILSYFYEVDICRITVATGFNPTDLSINANNGC